jgi:hypothetical protein
MERNTDLYFLRNIGVVCFFFEILTGVYIIAKILQKIKNEKIANKAT